MNQLGDLTVIYNKPTLCWLTHIYFFSKSCLTGFLELMMVLDDQGKWSQCLKFIYINTYSCLSIDYTIDCENCGGRGAVCCYCKSFIKCCLYFYTEIYDCGSVYSVLSRHSLSNWPATTALVTLVIFLIHQKHISQYTLVFNMNSNAQTNKTVLEKYLKLEQQGRWVVMVGNIDIVKVNAWNFL